MHSLYVGKQPQKGIRDMIRESLREAWNEPRVSVAGLSWAITVGYNVTLGLLFLLGGPERVSSPSFLVFRSFGGHVVAGYAFLFVGLLILVAALASPRILAVALSLGGVMSLLLAAGLWSAVMVEPPLPLDTPRAALIGPVPFLFVAAVHMIRARFYWDLEPRKATVAS